MFESFSADARRVVIRAQEHALHMRQDPVEPEHLLLAVAAGGGSAADGLRRLGGSPRAIRDRIATDSAGDRRRKVELADSVRAALNRARVEATILRHRRILPGHILLALVRDERARAILRDVGTSPDEIRWAVVPRLSLDA